MREETELLRKIERHLDDAAKGSKGFWVKFEKVTPFLSGVVIASVSTILGIALAGVRQANIIRQPQCGF